MNGRPATLLRVEAPHFVAGLVLCEGRVEATAPILRHMYGWSLERVLAHCHRLGWRAREVGQ